MSDILITDEQVAFFREHGYLHYGPILKPDELQEFQAEIRRLIELKNPSFYRADLGGKGDTPSGQENFLQMMGLWHVSEVVRRVTMDARRARIAAELLGVEQVRLLSDMVLYKPGRGSRATYWHQDYPNHPTSKPDVTAWIALDPTTIENGCMQYLPGSHKWGEVMGYDFGNGSEVARRGIDVSGAVAVEMQPGEVAFHHSLVMHYAGPNKTNKGRRAYITRYMPVNTVYRFLQEGRDSRELEGTPFPNEEYPVL